MSSTMSTPVSRSRPFLKWAGNKFRILDHVLPLVREARPERLVEPFAGAGAVFLNAGVGRNLVADVNRDLVELFKGIQSDPERFISECRRLFNPRNNRAEAYYRMRDIFNRTRDKQRKNLLFLYLNRHGYNGLCRYNAKGRFNVPFGRYKAPYFPEKELEAFARVSRSVEFRCQPFPVTLQETGEGDVVYCDPPYVPLSPTASFSSYCAEGFRPEDQERLAGCALAAARRGATVIISNHDNAETRRLYGGARIIPFEVRRLISCHGDRRSKAPELLAVYAPQAR